MKNSTKKISLLLSFLCLVPMPLKSQPGNKFADAWGTVSAQFHKTMQDSGIIGAALIFTKSGITVRSEYHGWADRQRGIPADSNTIFHWASITKTFTAIAVMQLRDRGLLSLDDPITDYLPELKKVHNPYGSMNDITIRQVMTHSSGFRAPTWPWGGTENWHPFEPTKWEQITAMFPYTKIHFAPGTRYSYSNPAYIFLGRIIEKVSGEDYEVFIDKNILRPLKMYHSYFDITPDYLKKDRSNNYYLADDSTITNGLDFDTGITVSNGGLNAPLKDMVKYLSLLSGNQKSDHVLRQKSLEEMWKKYHLIEKRGPLQFHMGLGFFIVETENIQVAGHTGSQMAFRSFFYLDPESKAAVIGVCNTSGRDNGPPHSARILAKLAQQLIADILPLLK